MLFFGEMIVKMISAIPESEEKWLLKLKIQQEIIHLRSRANQNQSSFNAPFIPSQRQDYGHFPSSSRPSSQLSMSSIYS